MSPTTGTTSSDVLAALDELFGAIDKYRTSEGFRELLDFLAKLPRVGPYNGLLLHIQRPGVTDVATVRGWQRLGREVKRDACPLVTLKTFGPIEFVYDVADTTGPDLPVDVSDPFRATGRVVPQVVARTKHNAEWDGIAVLERKFGTSLAGRVMGQSDGAVKLGTGAPAVLVIELAMNRSLESQYATLVHELAHVYCGHLAAPKGAWWTNRSSLDLRRREFEAEAVSWIVCSRQGLDPGSYRYLEGYLGVGKLMPAASLDQIVVAANHIETLGSRRFRRHKIDRARRDTPPRDGILSLNTGRPYNEEEDEEDRRLAAEIINQVESEKLEPGHR
jgi:hypothetical protein